MKYSVLIVLLVFSLVGNAQTNSTQQLSFEEYLGYVKQFHPITKQANLKLAEGEAYLMKARGGFDPKIEAQYDNKDFKGKDYYSLFNATFKVPTWYGIEVKANFEDNSGVYLNPQNKVPSDGLFTAGVSAALGQGLLINERMATLKKAKFYEAQTKAERDLMANAIVYTAALAYFDWLQAYNETAMYNRFYNNAKVRYQGVRQSVLAGDKAAIDSLEANININNRMLSLEQSKIKLTKYSLKASSFLWTDTGVPLEISKTTTPLTLNNQTVDTALQLNEALNFDILNHPKLVALDNKISVLNVDRQLKSNKLLPKVDVQYNFITQDPDMGNSYNTSNYKAGLNVAFPLFLRKERGDLKLAKLKVEATKFERLNESVSLENKIEALKQELESYVIQNEVIAKVVDDYNTLLKAEERKFSFGDSSVFLINYRESSVIKAELKQLKLNTKFYQTKAKLFKSLAIVLN